MELQKYLLNLDKRVSAAHLWSGSDTACKMYSTGGMRQEKYQLVDNPLGRKICLMCVNKSKK